MGEEGVIDHRKDNFYTREYLRNNQKNSEPQEQLSGFPPMKSVTQPPKPKGGTKQVSGKKKTTTDQQDSALKKANQKDLKNRSIK